MKPVLISISGKSGVGKTTISNMIAHCIGNSKCLVLSTDDLHKYDRYSTEWKKITHFNPIANNIELGDFHISNLLKERSIHRSVYNHHTGRFNPPILISPKPFIINEGLHAFYSDKMKKASDFKIYVDTDDKLTTLWKINRDTKFRGKSKKEVIKTIESRKKDNHYIESQKSDADLIVKFSLVKDEVKLNVNFINNKKNILFDKIISNLVNYFNNISTLVRLSKLYGSNEDYIQGPGGNISVKCLDNMIIKSSGIQLSNVDYFTGWSEIDTNYLNEYFLFANKLDDNKYFCILNESVQNNTIPSMESGMHSILKKYVIHTHPNQLMHILCNKDCKHILKELYNDIDYCYIPIAIPGLDLYEFIAKQDKLYDVYFLQNHGLIVTSDKEEDLKLHDIICNRAKSKILKTNKENNIDKYITPDEYIFRESTEKWFLDLKQYYNSIKNIENINFLTEDFLSRIDNLKFEKHRKSL